MKKLPIVCAAAFACWSGPVFAQTAAPLTFDKATVSGEVAKRTLVKAQITATVARQLVDASISRATSKAVPAPTRSMCSPRTATSSTRM